MAINFYSDVHLAANKLGRDADNLLDFSTDNQITFRVGAGDGVVFKASGEIEATKFDGALEGNADTATTAGTVTTAAQPEITTLVGVTSLGVASATTNILAGDLTIYGKRKSVTLIREQNRKRTFTSLDLTNKELFNSPYYYLAQNDIIYVEPLKSTLFREQASDYVFVISAVSTTLTAVALIINITK